MSWWCGRGGRAIVPPIPIARLFTYPDWYSCRVREAGHDIFEIVREHNSLNGFGFAVVEFTLVACAAILIAYGALPTREN
jgi:hypothetical protein